MPISQELSTNLGLDLLPNIKGGESAYDIGKLYTAVKILASALDDYTGALGADADTLSSADLSFFLLQRQSRIYRKAAVAIAAGQTVSLNSSGQFILGTVGTVIGWCPAAIAAGAYGEARCIGVCSSIGGLTAGAAYYASATAGYVTSTSTAQKIGIALDTTKLLFNPS